jgi:hypothetical protein
LVVDWRFAAMAAAEGDEKVDMSIGSGAAAVIVEVWGALNL